VSEETLSNLLHEERRFDPPEDVAEKRDVGDVTTLADSAVMVSIRAGLGVGDDGETA
jgi:hypothetical protein